eukprot:m.69779 g.69779  ORF g.69779 m.69779 type:complete len:523 (+) comp24140_c0_seq1:159-1727(+)
MEKYENLGKVGEGSYGMVIKCRNKETNQIVAIKKFLESEDDKQVHKIARREIKMLTMLRHDNLINLLEVFRKKKKLYLVFEFVERTLLDDLEKHIYGLELMTAKEYLWQILIAVEFCHSLQVIHRDVKPENILISKDNVVKLCDFGFARIMANSGTGPEHTDYVATRWYRAPELLVGDTSYGKPVDVWAIGCLLSEMLNAEPLFPGDSDIDQMGLIVKCLGNLTHSHTEVFLRNSLFTGIRLPMPHREPQTLEAKIPNVPPRAMSLLKGCLDLDPGKRLTCTQLLHHEFFTQARFNETFPEDLKTKIRKEQDRIAIQMQGKRRRNMKKKESKHESKLNETGDMKPSNHSVGDEKNSDSKAEQAAKIMHLPRLPGVAQTGKKGPESQTHPKFELPSVPVPQTPQQRDRERDREREHQKMSIKTKKQHHLPKGQFNTRVHETPIQANLPPPPNTTTTYTSGGDLSFNRDASSLSPNALGGSLMKQQQQHHHHHQHHDTTTDQDGIPVDSLVSDLSLQGSGSPSS